MAQRKRRHQQRKSFMLDADTLVDLEDIRTALRATSATEALRRAIQRYAKLVRAASSGMQIQLVTENTNDPPTVIDMCAR